MNCNSFEVKTTHGFAHFKKKKIDLLHIIEIIIKKKIVSCTNFEFR